MMAVRLKTKLYVYTMSLLFIKSPMSKDVFLAERSWSKVRTKTTGRLYQSHVRLGGPFI